MQTDPSRHTGWQQRLVNDDDGLRDVLAKTRRIAVIGIKGPGQGPAHSVPGYMKNHGYTIVPVNPFIDTVFDTDAVASVLELDEAVDMINVFRRSDTLVEHAREILQMKNRPRTVWFQLGIRNDEAARMLADAGIYVVQDRCLLIEHQRLGP